MNNMIKKTKAMAADLQIHLPPDIENLALPAPELVTYYRNLSNRTIWIDFEIDESCLEIERLILQWNKEDEGIPVEERKPIKLLIFSPGGGVVCLREPCGRDFHVQYKGDWRKHGRSGQCCLLYLSFLP